MTEPTSPPWPAEVLRDPQGLALLESPAVAMRPDVNGEQTIDVATARLYRQIVRSSRFCQLDHTDIAPDPRDVLVAVMPGAFHEHHPHTGADGQRVLDLAASFGCEAKRVPVGSFGRLEENAGQLIQFLNEHRGRRIIIVSLSKGSADVKTALRLSPDAFAGVSMWVSFSGMVCGTPNVRWLRDRPLRWLGVRAILWWKGLSLESLIELANGPGTPLCEWSTIPSHLRLIHVLGFPLRRHLAHPWAPRGYHRIAPLGPNDGGGILLSDVANWPGEVYPVWGADHYLQPQWDMKPLLSSLMRTALRR